MSRAHRELSIEYGVIKIQAIFCKFGFGKLAVALSTSWHAAASAPAGSGTQPIGLDVVFDYSQEPRWGSKVRGYEVIAGG